ncbi:MAG: hypothetical protein WCI78_00315 [Mycobacterium sp.]
MVPKDALVLGTGVPFVYVVDSTGADTSGTVRRVEVALGAAVGGNVEVRGAVTPGQLVVVRGNERLRPGMTVSFMP